MTQNIDGKVVVITGASSGLGEAAAKHVNIKGVLYGIGAVLPIMQPAQIDINEILYRPTRQEY
jgi:NADP-dependent 3-hydroxy acid dehydrogenase YdfG